MRFYLNPRTIIAAAGLLAGLLAPRAAAEPARYLRHPALSPDNQWIAFSYRGDIWRVPAAGGQAVRLTVHPARDQRPVWSPDGRLIAFASDREGQNDIFLIPAAGGPARRITFATGNEFPCDWSSDGAHILAESYELWRPDLVEVPVSGGPVRPVTGVPEEGEYFARYSPEDDQIVFCDGGGYVRWWWEKRTNARAGQLWKLARDSWPPAVERLSGPGTQVLWPGYSGRDIVATSNANGLANIVRFQPGRGEPVPVTAYSDAGVRWLRVSRDGSQAVFERQFRLWHIDLATDSVREISVDAPSDWIVSPLVEASTAGEIEEFSLSPDGKRIAFVAGGEVYLIAADDPEIARRLTRTDARERFCSFAPDGKRVVYVSDRNGRQNLHTVDTRSGEEAALTALTDVDVAKPIYTPDGKQIAFYLGNDRIARLPAEGGAMDTILMGGYYDFPLDPTQEFKFSPDGRYLAYTAFGAEYNADVWVYALDGSVNVNVTRRSRYNFNPTWSPNGRYLTFVSSDRGTRDLYALRLVPRPPEFPEARLDSLYDAAGSKNEDKKEKTTDDSIRVEIDFDRIHTRWVQVYPLAAQQNHLTQTPDGTYWLFTADLPGGENIWRIPVDPDSDEKPLQLTSGSKAKEWIVISPDSKTVYFLEDGHIARVGIDGKEQKRLSFATDYDYHPAARNAQKLREVWRVLGNYFYDPDLHGAAWDSLHDVYAAVLPHIALEDELRDLMKEFIGSLDASHLDIYGGTAGLPSGRQSGFLGVEFDAPALRTGDYRIGEIYPHGPVAQATAEVMIGDRLLAVNGVPLDGRVNVDSLLAGTVGERVHLTWMRGDDTIAAAVKPVSSSQQRNMRYEAWAESRRRLVDSLSNHRLGYLHIRSMNQTSLDRFRQELADQTANYEGLVIDVRYNGGGWTAVHLLDMLERQPFVLRNFRGRNTVSEIKYRSYSVEKPMILLINHFSASNSEIFAEGWRRLGLGKIVGWPTSAAVIGTGAYRLIDGTICRRPSWGAFTLDMENLELVGRQPDIALFNTQTDWLSGSDPQLARAIAELIADLR